jgi:diguanylate cyclase (GGDEF)-like protein
MGALLRFHVRKGVGMHFDMPTLVISAAIANMAIALGLAVVMRGQPAALNGSLPVWTRGIAILSFGLFQYGFRSNWHLFLSLVLANTLIALGVSECADALRRFRGLPRRRWLPYVLTAGILMMSIAFTLVSDDRYLRILVNTTLLAGIYASAALMAWRTREAEQSARSNRLVAAVFLIAAAILLARVAAVAIRGEQGLPAINTIDPIQGLFYAAIALGPVIGTLGFALMCNDRLNSELLRMANVDALTGVHNRRSLERQAHAALATARREGRPLSVLLLDADHFKRINDDYGHAAGDAALRALAGTLTAHVPEGAVVGRFGGEEFLVLLPQVDAGAAYLVAERIRTDVHGSPLSFSEHRLSLSISGGVAELAPTDADFDALARRADQALYRAKRDGRNRIEAAA